MTWWQIVLLALLTLSVYRAGLQEGRRDTAAAAYARGKTDGAVEMADTVEAALGQIIGISRILTRRCLRLRPPLTPTGRWAGLNRGCR